MTWSFHEKIPRDRIGVLLGVKGSVKERLEKETDVHIKVDSSSGDIEITPSKSMKDVSLALSVKNVVQAIARGFSAEKATLLLNEDALFESRDLEEDAGMSPSDIKRLQGRIIGREGKMRRTIEELTGASLSVYGNSVSIIGTSPGFEAAREAVKMLLDGRQHSSVYRYLSRERKKMRKMDLSLWEEKPEPREASKRRAQPRARSPPEA